MAAAKKNFSKKTRPNFSERALGLQGGTHKAIADWFSNPGARTGFGTSSLENFSEYPLVRFSFNYVQIYSLFESSWVCRRVVVAPAQDVLKTWPKVVSETTPKDLARFDRALRRTNTRAKILDAMTLGRLFGGAGALIAIDGQEHELDQPLDLDAVPLGGFRGLIPFDRWSGISPSIDVCTDINRPLDFGLPEYYEVRVKGGDSFQVHSSRIVRFCGPMMPEPENSAYSMWGISVLAPIIQSVVSYDNLSANALSLSYRAQILGMRMPELAQMLSGLTAGQATALKFEQRMERVNQMISNQSLVLLPEDGELSSTQFSFAGLAEILQSFQLQIAGAAKMPVTRLWGRTLNGLGQAGEGDERIYEETISTDAATSLRPALEKLFPVVFMSELGEVPDDMDLNFPSIRVLDEKEKSELAKSTADTLAVYLNSGIMSPQVVGKEVKESSDVTGIGSNLTDEFIEKLSDEVSSEGEMGEGMFGETSEGEPQLEAASGPQKVLREEGAEKGKQQKPGGKGGERTKAADAGGFNEGDRVIITEFGQLSGKTGVVFADNPTTEFSAYTGNSVQQLPIKLDGLGGRVVRVATFNLKHDKVSAKDEDGPAFAVRQVHGLTCVVETPRGFSRHGKDDQGRPWRQVMPAHYGYLQGHLGADGDSLDVYIGPDPESEWVYCVDQSVLGKRQKFDETKCMVGFASQGDALRAYNEGHHRASDVYLDFTPMRVEDFKEWLVTRDPRKPCSPEASAGFFGLRPPCSEAVDAAWEEAKHPRAPDGKFGKGSGGGIGGVPMPKGMEGVTKGTHKSGSTFAMELIGSGKYNFSQIAQAVQSQFGTAFSTSSAAYYKKKLDALTPEGKAALTKKKAGITANSEAITAAVASPMPAQKVNAALIAAETKNYKTVFVKGTGAGKGGYEPVFYKVGGVPDGVDKKEYLAKALAKHGVTSVSVVAPWDASKPTPPGVQDYTLNFAEAQTLKDDAYAKAAQDVAKAAAEKSAAAAANKPYTVIQETLSDAVQQSIKHYTNGSYSALNSCLREGKPMSAAQATLAAHLDEALSKAVMAESAVVYRGVSNAQAFFGKDVTIGTTIIDNGFISTSKKSSVGKHWGSGMACRIKIAKGKRALDVQSMSLHPGEAEVLLPRGSMFKITNIVGKIVELEYVSG